MPKLERESTRVVGREAARDALLEAAQPPWPISDDGAGVQRAGLSFFCSRCTSLGPKRRSTSLWIKVGENTPRYRMTPPITTRGSSVRRPLKASWIRGNSPKSELLTSTKRQVTALPKFLFSRLASESVISSRDLPLAHP